MNFFLPLTFFLLSLSACQSNTNTNNQAPSISQAQAEDTIISMNLLFGGDVMGHAPQITAAYNAESKTYDFNPCFKYVKPIIEDADMAIANLEVTLPGEGKYTGYPMFRSPDALADALKTAGFDMLVTANNHANDGGLKGVTHTIDKLKELDIIQTGTFKSQADRDKLYPLITRKMVDGKVVKLAFLNYTYGTNGVPDHKPSLVNLIDTAMIRRDVANAKSASPDAIIAVMHWGLEYQLDENKEQDAQAQFMANLGVDLIIGSHPHVVQPIKSLTAKLSNGKTKTVSVVYSLGNYISNQNQANTDIGLMVEVEMTKNTVTGKVSFATPSYIPIWRYIETTTTKAGSKKTYYALPVSAVEDDKGAKIGLSKADYEKMTTAATNLRKRLAKHSGTEKVFKASIWK